MKIQKILGILLALVMLLNVVTPVLAANEINDEDTQDSKNEIASNNSVELEKTTAKTTNEKSGEPTEETVATEEKTSKTVSATTKSAQENNNDTTDNDEGTTSTKANDTTSDSNSNTATDDDSDTNEEDETVWTDFSKAKYTLIKQGISGAAIEITGVTPIENRNYYLTIGGSNAKPNLDQISSKDRIRLRYDKDSKKLIADNDSKITENVELNQDLYISIIEQDALDYNVLVYGKKIERFSEPKYSDAFFATFVSHEADQIVTYFTHGKANNRKMQIKIGKITDNSILQKIKNEDATGFSDLLKYAKSNTGIFNKTLSADKDTDYAIQYNVGYGEKTNNELISLNGVEDGAYYYLYVKTDDENGKYISNEAVTLSKASSYKMNNKPDEWYMSFYGSDNFKWSDFSNNPGNTIDNNTVDNTIASGKIPQTGETAFVATLMVLVIALGSVGYINYRKYKGIK